MGIELGARPSLPTCPQAGPAKGLCVQNPGSETILLLSGLPFTDIVMTASVHLHDGKVAAVHLVPKQEDYARFRSILVEKYGEPTETEIAEITAISGAKATSETAVWRGNAVSITTIERFQRIDESIVVFGHLALQLEAAARLEQAKRDAASKL
ncbi:hypothetical protein [Steroidobacter sp.]|uniref:hypothetical protein n=1 Tax=Steroidobacter sp. TaxID=1978227 RepID=UPI002EDB7EB1